MSRDKSKQLGDKPIEDAYFNKMQVVAQTLDQFFNGRVGGPGRETGFILLVFPYDEKEGRCNYISNGADRADVVKMMEEQIKRFKEDGLG